MRLSSPPSESTQLEDPRVQWQREQECMLRDYLSVVRDALSAQKEIYQVKEQRLRLAQEEYRQLNDAWRDKSTSQTSCGSQNQAEQPVQRPVSDAFSLMLRSHSEFQIVLVQQVRPRHPESRNSHGQKSGRSRSVRGTVRPTHFRSTAVFSDCHSNFGMFLLLCR